MRFAALNLARLREVRFARYFIASVGALAIDFGSFLLLLQSQMPAAMAAAFGYTLGAAAHWVLLSRYVFQEGTAARGRQRTAQKALFLASTWAGLMVTSGIVGAAAAVGADVLVSKAPAVAISFFLNYLVRKHFVFAASPGSSAREA